jgi:aspartate/methionine/tyrosine aminotransferase
MLNPRLQLLSEYPFDRLRALLGGIDPPSGMAPMVLSVGEPRHPTPPLVHEVVGNCGDLWNRYPPVEGTADFRSAVVGWLNRRYALPDDLLDADRHVLPVAGTREALFLVAAVAVPRSKVGRKPVVSMPNPFYHVYFGATLMSGAEPVYLPASASPAAMISSLRSTSATRRSTTGGHRAGRWKRAPRSATESTTWSSSIRFPSGPAYRGCGPVSSPAIRG